MGRGSGTEAWASFACSICFNRSFSALTLLFWSSISDRRLFMALISALSSPMSSAFTGVAASDAIAAAIVPASMQRDKVPKASGPYLYGVVPPDSPSFRFCPKRFISPLHE